MRVQVAPRYFLSLVAFSLVSAAEPDKPQDISTMSPEAHAALFRTPKATNAGAVTERVTSALPKPAAHAGQMTRRNFIDEQVFGRMEREGIPHAPLSTDREFLRRVTLDLTGRIPTPFDTREFLADTAKDKRARLIDKLIANPAFAEKWAYFYMDLVRANGKMSRGVNLFHLMLKESIAADRPYDDLARSLMAASAKSNYVVAAVNPIVREHVEGKPGENDDPDDLRKVHQMDTHDEVSILFGKVFLGVNLSCIACHDGKAHLEKVNVYLSGKKRSDFFQQSAFMGHARYIAHVENKEAIMGHFSVDDASKGYDTKGDSMLRIKRFGGPTAPKFVLTDELAKANAEPREELGRMMTSHPQFARATVNMFWAKLMGAGIVEPFDEFDLARLDPKTLPAGWDLQPSNPELLEALADYFRKNNHSLHKLFSAICNSNAYQLSARFPGEWNDRYTKYYARKFARMLTAEEIHDAIAMATERPGKFGGAAKRKAGAAVNGDEPPVTQPVSMAMQVSLPRATGELKSFLQAFGQANRGTPARPAQPSPMQPIMLMRSPVVNDRVIAAHDSRVQRLLDSYKDDGKVVEELFVSALSREPSAEEKALAVNVMAKDRVEGAQNVQWALLNLVEFLYNF